MQTTHTIDAVSKLNAIAVDHPELSHGIAKMVQGILGDTRAYEPVAPNSHMNGYANRRINAEFWGSSARDDDFELNPPLTPKKEQARRTGWRHTTESKASPKGQSVPRKDWYTQDEAAILLGRNPYTIGDWLRHGRIKGEKLPIGSEGGISRWRISHAEIERYRITGLREFCACRNKSN